MKWRNSSKSLPTSGQILVYIFSCKYKDTKPSILEYIYQIESNLKLNNKFQLPQEAERFQTEVAQNTSVTVTT